ncbi:MAG: DUF294 nucleotidyltransferase-like domain-containing protein [Rhodospirillales bacterium]|nr:DUF294 nucleotidyltransferase-like domain-containing protein [Rhodospirillales bacterium]
MIPDESLLAIKKEAAAIYREAQAWCDDKISQATGCILDYQASEQVDLRDICFVVVGSVGRSEALAASDLDLVPIARTDQALEEYALRDAELRRRLCQTLKVKVSRGKNLTKAGTIGSLVERESIGGENDNSQNLTKRMLVLTESQQVGEGYELKVVKREILKAYEGEERSRGRHVLSLCNDIARYYRTLCIEYKTKADSESENWSTRNLKLRHSRKIWYFSSIVLFAKLAEQFPRGDCGYTSKLLQELEVSPVARLARALKDTQGVELGRLLETYAFFLRFMSEPSHRQRLSDVAHDERYSNLIDNPFPMLKFNSDLLHRHIVSIIEGMQRSTRQRVLDWFLF